MPELIPVEGDPFNDPPSNLVPVDHDPWAAAGTPPPGQMTDADRAQVMRTGEAIAAPIDAVMGAPSRAAAVNPYPPGSEEWQFYENSRTRGIEQAGPEMAMAMAGGGTPFAERGALGAAGGGIKAYHGSPHDFDAFDVSKIGTGEGAQAYGHGLYFAENPKTATSYKTAGGTTPAGIQYKGENIPNLPRDEYSSLPKLTRESLNFVKDEPNIGNAVQNATSNGRPDIADELMRLHSSGDLHQGFPKSGKMYEVSINADPEHFLDWDKPLSEQHPKVQETFAGKVSGNEPLGNAISRAQHNEMFAGDLVGMDRATPDQMIQKLHEAGIPGIKYLDQGSRITGDAAKIVENYGSREKALEVAQQRLKSASTGDLRYWDNIVNQLKNPETSNYVVFHHNLVDIIKKYGLAGLVAGGAAHFKTTPIDHDPYEKKKETAGAS